ncbi:hypothetical protein [Fundidesulfovibrio putealis]|uniref:hypothetical protein n=1 Tax=Fundidesulfovibrio putealis TaxID=270496 RepID=UPI00041AAFEB|nr:hypothetical protein [Fundidesulfovibrio putealis]
MLAVNVMRIRVAAPEHLKQKAAADDDDEVGSAKVLGLVRATTRAPGQETALGLRENVAMTTLTPTERRNTALRMGYAACLLPG